MKYGYYPQFHNSMNLSGLTKPKESTTEMDCSYYPGAFCADYEPKAQY